MKRQRDIPTNPTRSFAVRFPEEQWKEIERGFARERKNRDSLYNLSDYLRALINIGMSRQKQDQ